MISPLLLVPLVNRRTPQSMSSTNLIDNFNARSSLDYDHYKTDLEPSWSYADALEVYYIFIGFCKDLSHHRLPTCTHIILSFHEQQGMVEHGDFFLVGVKCWEIYTSNPKITW